VHFAKAPGFLAKMRDLYPVEATPGQRATAKLKRQANVQLVICLDQLQTGYLRWYLLVTPGRLHVDPVSGKIDEDRGFNDLIFQREPLKDARRIPINWMGHYRLIQRQKAADSKKRQSRKAVWTWALTKETFREWELRLSFAAKVDTLQLTRAEKVLLQALNEPDSSSRV
jgi:hypothetical protein